MFPHIIDIYSPRSVLFEILALTVSIGKRNVSLIHL
jgi:hypothetical protein